MKVFSKRLIIIKSKKGITSLNYARRSIIKMNIGNWLNEFYLLNEKSRNKSIEGFRGVAVLLVFNVHFFGNFAQKKYYSGSSGFLNGLFGTLHAGMIGVDIFFVLSGFLVWKILFIDKRSNARYFRSRLERLMPAYVLNLIIVSISAFSFSKFFTNLFFLPEIFPHFQWYNYVSWSLAWEWIFYILLITACILTKKNINKSVLIISTILLINFLFSYVIKQQTLVIPDALRFSGFYMGCLLSQHYKKLAKPFLKYFGIVSFFGLFLFSFLWSKHATFIASNKLFYGLYFVCIDIMAAMVINLLLNFESILKLLLSSKPFRMLGQISYTFYLSHSFVINAIAPASRATNIYSMISMYVLILAFTVIIASFLFYLTERNYFTAKSIKTNL